MKSSSSRVSFNIIDFLLIAVILTASITLGYVLLSPETNSPSGQPQTVLLEYQVLVPSLREEFQGKAGFNDTLIDSSAGLALGKISDITYADSIYHGINQQTGQTVSSPYPGYLAMTLTVQTEAEVKNGFYLVDGYEIQIGKKIAFRLPHLTGVGYISSVTVQEIEPDA